MAYKIDTNLKAAAERKREQHMSPARPGPRANETTEGVGRNAGVPRRVLYTAEDAWANLGQGAWKSIEGMGDFLVGAGVNVLTNPVAAFLVNPVAGVVSLALGKERREGIQDSAQEFIEKDLTGEAFRKASGVYKDITGHEYGDSELSYQKEGGAVEQIERGIGGMLPSVVATVATGGAGAGAMAQHAASLTALGTGAAGNAAEESYNDGASYGQGQVYGAVKGGIEVGTEMIGGGFTSGLYGKGLLPTVRHSVADVGLKRIVKSAAEEGMEEVASELADPLAKTIYKGKGALKEYKNPEYWKSVGEAGALGAATAAVYGGTIGAAMGQAGKNADVSEIQEEINTLEKKRANLFAHDRLTTANATIIDSDLTENYALLENTLKKASPKKRAQLIERFGLSEQFDADGNMRESLADELSGKTREGVDARYTSPKMSRDEMDKALGKDGRRAFTGDMGEASAKNYRDFKRTFGALSKKADGTIRFVVSEKSDTSDAYFDPETRAIVVGEDVFRGDGSTETVKKLWMETMIHEVTHSTEGTLGHVGLMEKLAGMDGVYDKAVEKFVRRRYMEGTPDEVKVRLKELSGKQFEELTESEKKQIGLFDSEVGAMMAADVLTNEHFARRLVREESGVAEALMSRMEDAKEAVGRIGNRQAQELHRALVAAEKMYTEAVEEAGWVYEMGKIVKSGGEKKEEEEKEKYSFGGKNARHVDERNFMDAIMMEQEGKSPEEIRKKTGWFRSNDRKWRFEIDDSGLKILYPFEKIGLGLETNLKNFIQHNKLFERYPELQYIDVKATDGKDIDGASDDPTKAYKGYYQKSNDTLYINPKWIENEDELKKLIMHEVQHIIQDREGFSSGANEEFWQSAINRGIETRRKYTKKEISGMYQDVKKAEKENPELYKAAADLANSLPDVPRGKFDFDTFEELEPDPPEWVKYDEKRDTYEQKFDYHELNKLERMIEKLNNPYYGEKRNARDLYFSTSGEVEARDTEKRLDMSEEQRKNEKPDYDREGVVFAEDVDRDVSFSKKETPESMTWEQAFGKQEKKAGTQDDVPMFDNSVEYEAYMNRERKENLSVEEAREAERKLKADMEGLTAMQRETVANYARQKVYARADAEKVIGEVADIIDRELAEGDNGKTNQFAKIIGKVKNKETDILWKAYNTETDRAKKEKIAGQIADHMIAETVLVTTASDDVIRGANDTLNILEPYVQGIDLSSVKEKMVERFGEKNARHIFGRWNNRKGEQGLSPEQIKKKIEAETRILIAEERPENIVAWLEDRYQNAIDNLKVTNESIDPKNMDDIKTEIVKTILKSYEENGKPSKWSIFKEKNDAKIFELRQEIREKTKYNKAAGRMAYLAQGVKDWKSGVFRNQTQPDGADVFKQTIGSLAKLTKQGVMITPKAVREKIKALSEWFDSEETSNILAEGQDMNQYRAETAEVRQWMAEVAEGEGKLTAEEIENINKVIKYFRHKVETFHTVWRDGKRVDAVPVAAEYVKIMRHNVDTKFPFLDRLYKNAYMRMEGDPYMIMRYMDRYQHGFYTQTLENLREGAMRADKYQFDIDKQIISFEEKHKGYFKKLKNQTVKIEAFEIPKAEAMYLYMALNRKQAIQGLLQNGFVWTDAGGTKHRMNGFTDENVLDKEGRVKPEFAQMIENYQTQIEECLNEEDKAYIRLCDKLFNEDCRKLKEQTDLERMGYSNVTGSYYIPIKRAYTAKDIDRQIMFDETQRISNATFNKDTRQGARGELEVEPLPDVLNRHVRGVTMYAGLSRSVDEFKLIYNINVQSEVTGEPDNANKPLSVQTEENSTWNVEPKIFKNKDKKPVIGYNYFVKMISDIQGIKPSDQNELNRIFGKLRGNYAKAVLSINPKVILTQLSSLAASTSIIRPHNLIRGFNLSTKDVDRYSDLAAMRNAENTAAMAQGLLDNAEDTLMKPIGFTDRYVVKRIFAAAQYQVAEDKGLKLGTEENKREAGKLLTEVILSTQQNAMATEKSEAARSYSEIHKMFTMFTSDSVKMMGRVLDSFGEWYILQKDGGGRTIGTTPEMIKKAESNFRKSFGALAAVAVYTTILSAIISHILRRDKEKPDAAEIGADFFGNMIGGLPIISDVYDKMTSGYDIEDMTVSGLNDMLDAMINLNKVGEGAFHGDVDSRDMARALRDTLYTIGQTAGLPLKNLGKWIKAAANWITPELAYTESDRYYKHSYRADIKKAIEEEDEEYLETIIGVALDENVGAVPSERVRKEMARLSQSGFSVIPHGIGSEISVEGDTVKVTQKQRKKFKVAYKQATGAVERMMSMTQYVKASDEAKAKAVNQIYGIYYNRGLDDILGIETEKKNDLFAMAINPDLLAIASAVCQTMAAEKDKNGKAVAGSKKKKIMAYIEGLKLKAAQKYMILGYLGYKNTQGRREVRTYIQSLPMSKRQKDALFSYSGYTVE